MQPIAADSQPEYRVLVPIVNPQTQQGLIQLAVAIALGETPMTANSLVSAAVYPLSLIQLEEDYAFESTPAEADRQIALRQKQVRELVERLEPAAIRPFVQPIVRVASDVVQETARVAEIDQTDLILLGWHRPAFSKNRLGGRVGQVLSTAKTDVAVFIDRQHSKLETILVPYMPNIHNDLGLEIALRLLVNSRNCTLTILRVEPNQPASDLHVNDLTHEFRNLLDRLPDAVRQRIHIPHMRAETPIQAVVEASSQVDLTIAGASREWGLDRQTLGFYTDELAVQCQSSLLITRRYSRMSSHLASILDPVQHASLIAASASQSHPHPSA